MDFVGDEILHEILKHVSIKDRLRSTQYVNVAFHRATWFSLSRNLLLTEEGCITGYIFTQLVRRCCKTLTCLDLEHCHWLKSGDLQCIKSCRNLESLNLLNCPKLTAKCLLNVLSGLKNLKELSLTVSRFLAKGIVAAYKTKPPQINISLRKLTISCDDIEVDRQKVFFKDFIYSSLCSKNVSLDYLSIQLSSIRIEEFVKYCFSSPLLQMLEQAKSFSVYCCLHATVKVIDAVLRRKDLHSYFFTQLVDPYQWKKISVEKDHFGNLKRLHATLRDISPVERTTFTHLEELYIVALPEVLRMIDAPNLRKLHMERVGPLPDLSDWCQTLTRFPLLTELKLDNVVHVTEELLIFMQNKNFANNIKSLDLGPDIFRQTVNPNCEKMVDQLLQTLPCMTNLQCLVLRGSEHSVRSLSLDVISSLTTLTQLTIECFPHLKNFGFLRKIGKNCRYLTSLTLKSLGLPGHAAFLLPLSQAITMLPNLHTLRLYHRSAVFTKSFGESLLLCTRMKNFEFFSAYGRIDGEIFYILKKFVVACVDLLILHIYVAEFPLGIREKFQQSLKPIYEGRPGLHVEISKYETFVSNNWSAHCAICYT